jgi:glucose dehydrogenase
VGVFGVEWSPASAGPPPQVNKEAVVGAVPFDRILHASQQEPESWLTYSGGFSSQRHSELKQITPENAKDLTLKWFSSLARWRSTKSRP